MYCFSSLVKILCPSCYDVGFLNILFAHSRCPIDINSLHYVEIFTTLNAVYGMKMIYFSVLREEKDAHTHALCILKQHCDLFYCSAELQVPSLPLPGCLHAFRLVSFLRRENCRAVLGLNLTVSEHVQLLLPGQQTTTNFIVRGRRCCHCAYMRTHPLSLGAFPTVLPLFSEAAACQASTGEAFCVCVGGV